jgi:hypothetical protein
MELWRILCARYESPLSAILSERSEQALFQHVFCGRKEFTRATSKARIAMRLARDTG